MTEHFDDYDDGLMQTALAEQYEREPTMDPHAFWAAIQRSHGEHGGRDDETPDYMRQADYIAERLLSAGERGLTTVDLTPITPRYGARLETLRRAGFVIDACRIDQRVWRYVLRGVIPDYEPPPRNLRMEIPGRYVDMMRRAGLATRQDRIKFVLCCLDSFLDDGSQP